MLHTMIRTGTNRFHPVLSHKLALSYLASERRQNKTVLNVFLEI